MCAWVAGEYGVYGYDTVDAKSSGDVYVPMVAAALMAAGSGCDSCT